MNWNRLLSLMVLGAWIIIGSMNGGMSPAFFFWAAMSFAFIWWNDEMAFIVGTPPIVLRTVAWIMLLLPVIVGVIVASVNSDLHSN